MKFVKNHFYKDVETKRILVFDNMLKTTSNVSEQHDIYFFTEIETYSPVLYFGKETERLKEY